VCSNTSRAGSRGLAREARRTEVDSTPASIRRTHPGFVVGMGTSPTWIRHSKGVGQMRRIGDPVEPLSGGLEQPPLAFRWQGRRYIVGSVLAHWVETGAWWRAAGPLTDPERQLWRVEVCRGESTGVFDLCQDTTGWSLRAVHD